MNNLNVSISIIVSYFIIATYFMVNALVVIVLYNFGKVEFYTLYSLALALFKISVYIAYVFILLVLFNIIVYFTKLFKDKKVKKC